MAGKELIPFVTSKASNTQCLDPMEEYFAEALMEEVLSFSMTPMATPWSGARRWEPRGARGSRPTTMVGQPDHKPAPPQVLWAFTFTKEGTNQVRPTSETLQQEVEEEDWCHHFQTLSRWEYTRAAVEARRRVGPILGDQGWRHHPAWLPKGKDIARWPATTAASQDLGSPTASKEGGSRYYR